MERSPEKTRSASWTAAGIGLLLGLYFAWIAHLIPKFAAAFPDRTRDLWGRPMPEPSAFLFAVPRWSWLATGAALVASGIVAGYCLRGRRLSDHLHHFLWLLAFAFVFLSGALAVISLFLPMLRPLG